MTLAEVLDQAQAAGVTLWAEGDTLRYRGPHDAITKLLPELKAHKPAILAALGRPLARIKAQGTRRLRHAAGGYRRWAIVGWPGRSGP